MPVRRWCDDGPKQEWPIRTTLVHRRVAACRRTPSITPAAPVRIRAAAKVVDARVHTVQVATGRGAAGAAQRVVVCKYSGSEVWLWCRLRWRSRGWRRRRRRRRRWRGRRHRMLALRDHGPIRQRSRSQVRCAIREERQQNARASCVAHRWEAGRAVLPRLVAALPIHHCCARSQVTARAGA